MLLRFLQCSRASCITDDRLRIAVAAFAFRSRNASDRFHNAAARFRIPSRAAVR